MEGTPTDIAPTPEKKGEDKKDKKSEKAAGLGKSSFEFAHKKEAAEKIADSKSIWEKLIPKDGGEKTPLEVPPVALSTEKKAEASVELAEDIHDPAVENLSQVEQSEVVKDYVQEKSAELEAGRGTDDDPAEAAAREANIEYLKTVEQEQAAVPVDTAEVASTEAQAEDGVEAGQSESEDTPAELQHGDAIELNAPEQTDEDDAMTQQASFQAPPPVMPTANTAPNTPPNPNTPPPTPTVPPAAGGAGNQPPNTPNAPPTGPGGPGGPNFNAVPPIGVNPNAAPPTTRVEYYRDRRSDGTYFLAGGILGYMLGKRRGRIKTEKRLKAVSQKLEKQITDIRQQVVRQEEVIRKQARERYNERAEAKQAAPKAEQPRGVEAAAVLVGTVPRSAEQAPVGAGVASRKVETGRSAASRNAEAAPKLSQAEVASNQRQAAERLGIAPAEAGATAERVQSMNHSDVLALAEKVSVDGTSLRTIYEAKQITEPGLRRITREFLRGGDVKAALQAEIKVKEMQYERDPQMRDRLAASYAGVDAAQPQTSTEGMASLLAQGVNASTAQQRREEKSDDGKAAADAKKERGKQVLISAWAAFVVVLVITAVVLAAR